MDDKSSILPWNVTGIQKGSLQTITSDKLASFAIGANKKSRFQKNREEKEAKEKAEAQAAAQVYNSFVASFEGDDDDDDNNNNQNMPLKAFVKESTSTITTQIKSKTSNMDILFNEMKQKERDDVKRNTSLHPSPYTNNINNTTTNSNSNYINTTTTSTTSNKDRVKEMDLFLEELKNKNANDYQRSENYLPSRADDNISTNLYIGNINPNVTEERLYDLFSKYGDINSIKIMWPRSEEERIRRRNCGFVSFMKRKDAENAINELHDYNLEDYKMNLQWSKSVKINATPFMLATRNPSHDIINTTQAAVEETKMMMNEGKSFMEIYQTTLATFQNDPYTNTATSSSTVNRKWDEVPSTNEREMVEGDDCILIMIPEDKKIQNLIDLTAKFVAADGDCFEKVIRQREEANPLFNFLFQSDSSEGQYYRWRTYANIVGDTGKTYRTKPFQLIVGGPFIIPPKNNRKRSRADEGDNEHSKVRRRSRSRSNSTSSYDSDSSSSDDLKYEGMTGAQIERAKANEKAKARAKQKRLSQRSYTKFKDIILNLTISNNCIKDAMGFVYDHVESAGEIINILKTSLINDEIMIPNSHETYDETDCTPMLMPASAKIARLYLISDILYNSGAPIKNASVYRTLLQPLLPEIFEHFGSVLRTKYKIGRLSGKQIEEKVNSIMNAWMEWSILPQTFMLGLEAAFKYTDADIENIKSVAEKDRCESNSLETYVDKDALLRQAKAHGIYYTESSTPSEIKLKLELSERFALNKHGIKQNQGTINIDGVPIDDDDIDGVPIDDDDIDGVPIDDDDDIDGVPIDNESIDGVPIDDIDGVPIE